MTATRTPSRWSIVNRDHVAGPAMNTTGEIWACLFYDYSANQKRSLPGTRCAGMITDVGKSGGDLVGPVAKDCGNSDGSTS